MTFAALPRFCLAALATIAATAAGAQEFEKNILTGSATGTYIQFGRDISGIVAECGQTLTVNESAGSLENFLGVRKRPNTQFGIVQSDVLEYLRTYAAEDPDIAKAIAGVRIMYPLYNEEVHLLGRREIGGLGDLDGRKVAIGVQDSGTFLTASLALDLVGAEPERLTIAPAEAMEELLAGRIDALFYVAGAPTALFNESRIDPETHHLVPLTDPLLEAVYQPATIPADTYPFQSEPVQGIAVKAVLMTYDYSPTRNAYHRASCAAVRDITHLILTRFDDLKSDGHPKWQQVDLQEIPPGWDVAACVNAGLDPGYMLECAPPPEAAAADSTANSAYRQRICAAVGC